ncbi:CBN-SRX-137 protein [Caenorhabditis brenneri]|uniref:CBN-SRX-137 protein n=1 Tax=Caenorhabditis brenneri TaxID=135651 RepID=G0MRP7_CAEBE|nr:CBN-SRX-137 protein [Caenorhabditis brenneri]
MLALFPLLAVISMLVTSFIGVVVSVSIFLKFAKKPGEFSDFHKFCMVKTIPDMFVCGAFLFWVTPVTALSLTYAKVPYLPNVFIGQIASGGAYILGASIQMCMAANRFFVIYFPFRQHKGKRSYATYFAITICIGLAITYTLLGLRKLCAYVYDPEIFSWRVEESECADQMTTLIFWSIIVLAVTSNTFNVATALKFLCTQASGIRQADAARRRKKRLWLFVQCVIQDCLHLTDLINSIFLFQLSEEIWFRYIFLCYSFLAIHAADGIVMLYFNQEVQPKWFRNIGTSRHLSRTGVVVVSSHHSAPREMSNVA